MRLVIGSDHRGVEHKAALVKALQGAGHQVEDVGPFNDSAIDYPDVAARVAAKVSHGQVDRGLLICGTGIGMSIAANKYHGVRAAPVSDAKTAGLFRSHNDGNVLCLPANTLDPAGMESVVRVWMETPFEGGRHAKRLEKIDAIERAESTSADSGGGCR